MKNNKQIIFLIMLVIILAGCKNKSKDSEKKNLINELDLGGGVDSKNQKGNELQVIYSENKESLVAYYSLPHIKEFYDWQDMTYTKPDDLNFPSDLSDLSYDELRLLRNEIFARNGHLFTDGFLRGYFNRYKWYMPIFDVDTFKVVLNSQERELINKILTEEAKRKEELTVKRGSLELFNSELIVNKKQFVQIPEKTANDFKSQNFSIVNTNRSMPFFIYDENAYQYIPHFITTDLYLFILHRYFSKFLEKLDENYIYNELKSILTTTSQKLNEYNNPSFQSSIEWAETYNALALYALGDSLVSAPDQYMSIFKEETLRIKKQDGGPLFIPNMFVDFSEMKPRGHYTKSDNLKRYFKGFKWISLNGIDLKNEDQLKGMILFAYTIKNDSKLLQQYQNYITIIEKLAGQEDNLSLTDIINSVSSRSLDEALSQKGIEQVRKKLDHLNKEKIKKVFGDSFSVEERDIKRVYFMSSTYSICGEIFSKLVHIDLADSKRPFPRGLDIPAVFGNATAENIILNDFKDQEKWPEYRQRLKILQDQFKDFRNWDHNYGFKGLQTAIAASSEMDSYPDFMKTDAYNRKELSTTLASWTHIKHDLILYHEKPFAAQAGQGGGPMPPRHISYVEPNLEFWNLSLELVAWLESLTKNESTYNYQLRRIKELGQILRTVAYKQINKEEITIEEFRKMHYVGGTIEHILLGLLETDHLPERERSMALITDVYVYNNLNLNVAVGHSDDIYAIVPINGEYYITRGAVFSYYEFTGPIYNDEEWKEMIRKNRTPDRPEWIKPLINYSKPLEGQMQFRYPGHGTY